MKKLFTLLFCLLLVIGLVGCDDDKIEDEIETKQDAPKKSTTTYNYEDLEKRINTLIDKIDTNTASDHDTYLSLNNELDALEEEVDNEEDKVEASYANDELSKDDFQKYSNTLNGYDQLLSNAENKLEVQFPDFDD